MADIPKETLDVVLKAFCCPNGCEEAIRGTGGLCGAHYWSDSMPAAILAYHADLKRRGLKVVPKVPTPKMIAAMVGYTDFIYCDHIPDAGAQRAEMKIAWYAALDAAEDIL